MKLTVPPRLTRALSRYAVPLTVVAAVLLLGSAVAVAALIGPGGFAVPSATRVSQTAELPETLQLGLIDQADADKDGLGDALENYVYGTNPANWNSSGTGIPDGWLVAAGYDPLSPATRTARGAYPAPDALPDAYGGEWPESLRLPLLAYYEVGKPSDYVPGESDPWWVGKPFANPSKVLGASGLPTAWLVHYGLDPNDADLADEPAEGGESPLTVREAFEWNTNPHAADSDGDGLGDLDEIETHGTDPSRFSTSGSGLADGWAVHYELDPKDRDVASLDPDRDGLTNLEEFLRSYQDFKAEVEADGFDVLYARGLDPNEWSTGGSGIPDGWYVTYGLDPYSSAEADRLLQKASDFAQVKWLDDAPAGLEPIPDLRMAVRDAYAHGRPASWKEAVDGVWWGGTNPNTPDGDSDGDGLPDAVEIRGWYVNVTFGVGPQPDARWIVVSSNPTDPDSDADGLVDLDEYLGVVACAADDRRAFKPTDPRNKDTAFSGLTDREKVCAVVRGAFTYDFGKDGRAGLDPTRADSAGDYMRDGQKLEYWHERHVRYLASTKYEYANSSFGDLLDWAGKYARFAAMPPEDVVKEFRPDGDVDGDGLANVLDPDPSGGLVDAKNPRVVLLQQGLQIDPALYRFSEYRSQFPRSTTDPANPDTDGDGLPDWWEIKYGVYAPEAGGFNLDPSKFASLGNGESDAKRNDDADTVTWYGYRTSASGSRVRIASGLENQPYDYNNLEEYVYGTNPNLASTAGDAIPDGWKVFWGLLYPNLAAQGGAGELTPEELDLVQKGSGTIGPLVDLRGEGNPLKVQPYARFVNVTSCAATKEDAYRALTDLADHERLAAGEAVQPEAPGIRVDCPISTLSGINQPIARIVGTFELTYKREAEYGTNPYLVDTDGDGASDAYEVCHMRPATRQPINERTERGCSGFALPNDGPTTPNPTAPDVGVDLDADGGDTPTESQAPKAIGLCGVTPTGDEACGSDPVQADTDLDGVDDGLEIGAKLNPLDPSDVVKFKSQVDLDGDGILDYQELTGWGKAYYGSVVKTDPSDADGDDRGCDGDAAPWGGDGLLDGDVMLLEPDAPTAALWRALGIAWYAEGALQRFLGEVPNSNPRLADSSCDGIPDGWQGYYFARGVAARHAGTADADNVLNYQKGRPEWWNEQIHGVWWWGARPGDSDNTDLDNDGLDDLRGEDPFPSTSLNRYEHGDFATNDPEAAKAYVLAAPTPTEARRRAQAFGETAGNPLEGRGAAASVNRFPANVRLDGVTVASGGAPLDTGGFEVRKGQEFVITGRLIVAESGADSGKGVPNATVLVSALAADPEAVLGAAFTDADGRFEVRANITPDHEVDAPAGLFLFGKTGGPVAWSIDPRAIEVGGTTRGFANELVVWTYATPTPPPPGSPYASYAITKASGVVADSIRSAEAPAIPVLVSSSTRVGFDVASPALNGGIVDGTVTLTDASGAPLADRNVTIRWTGAGLDPLVLGATGNVKIRTDEKGAVNLTRLEIPVGRIEPGAAELRVAFHPSPTVDPFLRSVDSPITLEIRNPVTLEAIALASNLAVGSDLVVEGSLRTLPYDVPGHGTVAGAPVEGEQVKVELGSVVAYALTDSAGRYRARLEVPGDINPGENQVKVSYAGDNRLQAAGPIVSEVLVKRTTEIIALKDLSASRGDVVTVSGRLVDNREDGLKERIVQIVVGGRPLARTDTGTGGAFLARVTVPHDLALGNADVTVRFGGDDEYAPTSNNTRLKVFTHTTIEVLDSATPVVRGHDYWSRGRLVDAAGRGVAQGAVELYWNGEAVGHAITAADGAFNLTYAVPSSERLGPAQVGILYGPAATSVYRPSTLGDEVRVLAGVTLELPPKDVRRGLVTVIGRLLDDRGNALPGQPIAVTWNGIEAGSWRTVRNGSFAVPYEVPGADSAGPVQIVAQYRPPPDSRYAPAKNATEYALLGTPKIVLETASPLVRGEALELAGAFTQDNGAAIRGVLDVKLGDRKLGEATAADGRFTFAEEIPGDVPRGETTLVLEYAGTRYLDPARLEIPVVVKVRPQVEVDLPSVTLAGLAYSGDLVLRDDNGEPLRNQSFVYVVSGNPQPIHGATDAEGKAVLTGVGRDGGSVISLTIKGGPDIVPTEYETTSVRVVGAGLATGVAAAGILAAIVLALVVAGLAYGYYRRRQLEEVRSIIDKAIDELVAGNEYVGTIFLAYKRLSAHLSNYGFIEKKEDTAREFAGGVRKALPIGADSLRVLIRLFEEAKYSDHAVGAPERDRAIESLTRVRGEIDELIGRRKAAAPTGVVPS